MFIKNLQNFVKDKNKENLLKIAEEEEEDGKK